MANNVAEEEFSAYFERWFCEFGALLGQLVRAANQAKTTSSSAASATDLQALVARVTTHIKAYYTVKWAAAHDNVLAFFCPEWLSPIEVTLQWMTGWKPSTIFRLVDSLKENWLDSLREPQARRIAELRARIRLEEDKVERAMERQQVAVADRRTVELVRRLPISAGDNWEVRARVARTEAGLEKIMKAADCVRLKTLKGVLDELSPLQSVELLAAHAAVLLRIRHLGQMRSSASAA